MKKVFFGAALCSAAVALAAAANAEVTSDSSDFLSGSTSALILGATGVPTPSAAYISEAWGLYLGPNGWDGTIESALPLTTPGTFDFFQSVPQGEEILVNAIVAAYESGDMDCDAAGFCSEPLTIFTYSQSSAVAALAQQQLADANIPSDALRFVMLGANPDGVPDDLYPTEVYNIHGDFFADPGSLAGTTWQDILFAMGLHLAYMGLTPAQIDSATPVVDGMTTVYEIPTLSMSELWAALFSALFNAA